MRAEMGGSGHEARAEGSLSDLAPEEVLELNRIVLASLASHVAVVDRDGTILTVNEAWLRFGRDNGAPSDAAIALGANYLDVCRKASRAQAEDSRRALEGIESVLLGSSPVYELEYGCHSPTTERWFVMSVLPLRRPRGGAVVVHTDVTRRRQAEAELKRAYAEIQGLKDRLERENLYLRDQVRLQHRHEDILGESAAIRSVLSQVEQVAATGSTVLLLGETGTGKELLAGQIHKLSSRRERPMVKVNCAALPSTLVESELFGRERGAYTGALSKQIGRFEVADGSTIFLDEIGELPLELQVKLLRVLQEGRFERLGSSKTLRVDVRVIAATNRDLARAVREGTFRQDLYYRLNVFPIQVPPLRERREDIPLLVWAVVEELSAMLGKPIETIPRRTMQTLQSYSWPGNVRELKNVIERAMILSRGPVLEVALPDAEGAEALLGRTLDEVQRRHIQRVLESVGGRISGRGGAAEILGLKPTTLRSRMGRLGIRPRQP